MKIRNQFCLLTDSLTGEQLDPYRDSIDPIDYDFALHRGAEYFVIGLQKRHNVDWLYVSPLLGGADLQIVPAALFLVPETSLADTLKNDFKCVEYGTEIIPRSLSKFGNWHERFLDGDCEVIEAVSFVIKDFALTRH